MNLLTPRLAYFWAFITTLLLFSFALYLQFVDGIAPCPLCILQRLDLGIIALLFFFGAILPLKKWGNVLFGGLSFLLSIGGILLAGRQIWIQHLPPNQTADCGVSLQYMLQVLPLDEVLKKIFAGSAECSLVDWSFFNFSMAQWSLLWFVIFAIFALWQMFRSYR